MERTFLPAPLAPGGERARGTNVSSGPPGTRRRADSWNERSLPEPGVRSVGPMERTSLPCCSAPGGLSLSSGPSAPAPLCPPPRLPQPRAHAGVRQRRCRRGARAGARAGPPGDWRLGGAAPRRADVQLRGPSRPALHRQHRAELHAAVGGHRHGTGPPGRSPRRVGALAARAQPREWRVLPHAGPRGISRTAGGEKKEGATDRASRVGGLEKDFPA